MEERGTALAQVGTQRVGRFHRLSGGWVNTFREAHQISKCASVSFELRLSIQDRGYSRSTKRFGNVRISQGSVGRHVSTLLDLT